MSKDMVAKARGTGSRVLEALGAGLGRILDMNFGEHVFHTLG
jgi:hypothetical protein